jgi:flagellar biosynthesis protein FlhG
MTPDILARPMGEAQEPYAGEEAAQVPSEKRRHDHKHPPLGHMIAVTSGKGGVGKSNIGTNLAVQLATDGVGVALVDADLGMGNVDVLLGASGGFSLADVIAGRKEMAEILIELPYGLHVAAGRSGPFAGYAEPAWRGRLLKGLMELRHSHEITILDCGSGIGRNVLDPCLLADHILIVTTPEPTAMTDAYGAIKAIHREGYGGRISLVVNQAHSVQEAKAIYARLSDVAGRFMSQVVYDAGFVLTDPKVPTAVRKRQPFVMAFPRCPASRSVSALAAKLCPQGLAIGQRKRLWGRLAGWIKGKA